MQQGELHRLCCWALRRKGSHGRRTPKKRHKPCLMDAGRLAWRKRQTGAPYFVQECTGTDFGRAGSSSRRTRLRRSNRRTHVVGNASRMAARGAHAGRMETEKCAGTDSNRRTPKRLAPQASTVGQAWLPAHVVGPA